MGSWAFHKEKLPMLMTGPSDDAGAVGGDGGGVAPCKELLAWTKSS